MNTDSSSINKPRLIFFQHKYGKNLQPFLITHKQEHVACLSLFFDVVVIDDDCNFEQVCDLYHPDLVLFEAGVNHASCQRPKILNIGSNREIPKIALHHADAFCDARAGFLSDMDHLGIETFFAISTTAGHHNPTIADNYLYWPVFIDPFIYKDYKIPKVVPVLLTGNANSFYPWRQEVFQKLCQNYPSIICPHPGYMSGRKGPYIMFGEEYARAISASWFAPACGTVAKEAVRKHFEIPGCRSCLLTEQSAALEAAGFIDMKNCIFVDEHNVLDKVEFLIKNLDILNKITDKGYNLIHSRHTMSYRNQIYEWYRLNKIKTSSQRIVQLNPFDAPILVNDPSLQTTYHVVSDGIHLDFLRDGDKYFQNGEYEKAMTCYRRCINYMRWMPEPKLRMAITNLYIGDAKSALRWVEEPIQFVLVTYHAADPDPVEWAYFVICLLCLGDLTGAVKHSEQYERLRHLELDRVRWAVKVLKNPEANYSLPKDQQKRYRRSIHSDFIADSEKWVEHLYKMLKACGQVAMAEVVTSYSLKAKKGNVKAVTDYTTLQRHVKLQTAKERLFALSYFKRKTFTGFLVIKAKLLMLSLFHSAEGRFGYFLPYRLSKMRDDEFCGKVFDIARNQKIHTALLLGTNRRNGAVEALVSGFEQNTEFTRVFILQESQIFFKNSMSHSGISIEICDFATTDGKMIPLEKMHDLVESLKTKQHIDRFDLIFIKGIQLPSDISEDRQLMHEIAQAKIIILENVTAASNFGIRDFLLKSSSYVLWAENPGLRQGYAIFRSFQESENI